MRSYTDHDGLGDHARAEDDERAGDDNTDAADPADLPPDVVVPTALREGPGRTPEGAAWLTRLPALVHAARDRWGLRTGEPFPSGQTAWTAPARTRRGEDAVVKVVFPHDEAAGEPAALRLWVGHPAAELLDHDADSWTLLLRRYRPGHGLEDDPVLRESPPERRLEAAAEVMTELHLPDPDDARGPIRPLGEVTTDLADLLRVRTEQHGAVLAADRGLLADAAALLIELPGGASRSVLLHGDLNPGNLIADDDGGTRRWVAIDPKPLVGDPAFDPWPLLTQTADPFTDASPSVLRARTRLVAAVAGVEADRIAAWAMARACESALWRLAKMRDRDGAIEELNQARVWSRLTG